MGWNTGNLIATIGAFILGLGIAIYFAAMIYTYFKGERAGPDPWDARTLEWSIPSPPPEYNFAVTPTVHARDAWWYEKHHREEMAQEKAAHAKDGGGPRRHPHAGPVVLSVLAAAGLLIGGLALPTTASAGALVGVGDPASSSVYLWALEGNGGYHVHPDGAGDGSTRPGPTHQTLPPTAFPPP